MFGRLQEFAIMIKGILKGCALLEGGQVMFEQSFESVVQMGIQIQFCQNQRMSKAEVKLSKSQSLRQRITPTFVHEPIFNDYPSLQSKTRFTPTFASTVFDCQGYSIPTVHSPSKASQKIPAPAPVCTSVYRNVSKQRKQIEFTSCQHEDPYGDAKCCDLKDQLMLQTKDYGARTSRMRKMVELMSNPIFGPAYVWESERQKKAQEKAEPYVKENYQEKSQKKEEVQKTAKETGQSAQKRVDKNSEDIIQTKPAPKVPKEAAKGRNGKDEGKKGGANKKKSNGLVGKGGLRNQRK